MSDFDFPTAFAAASAELHRRELRRIFEAYAHPMNEFFGLLDALGSIQKEFPNWIEHVNDVMRGMALHDMASFPDEWLEELDGGSA